VRASAASWRTSLQLRRMRSLLWGRVIDAKLQVLEGAVKAFDPNQPRVPAGNSDGGQWTDGSGASSDGAGEDDRAGADHRSSNVILASFEPDDEPPRIPQKRPPTSRARTRIYKELVTWLARQVVTKSVRALLTILDQAGWLEPAIDSIRSFADPPKSLEQLQKDVSTPAPGYDVHHIVEQTSALRDGFPSSRVNAPENLVRIPRLKHWMITGWYMMKNDRYGDVSPRTYLRGKSWEERQRVGRDALIKHGVLKR